MRLNRRRIAFLAVVLIGMSGWGWVFHRAWMARQNHQVKTWVQSYGGHVYWSFQSNLVGVKDRNRRTPGFLRSLFGGEPVLDDIVGVTVMGSAAIGLDEIRSLERLPRLKWVYLSVSTLDDSHVEAICRLEAIRELDLGTSQITDAGLAMIGANLPRLEALYLASTSITGDGLRHLAKLTGLKELEIGYTEAGDEHLVHLRPFQELRYLSVGEHVTDKGIPEIARLSMLNKVEFFNSPVTDRGMDILLEGLPELKDLTLFYTLVNGEKMAAIEKAGILLEAAY